MNRQLAKQMKTNISFDVEGQFFEITGRSQQSCDDTYVYTLYKVCVWGGVERILTWFTLL